MPNLLDNWTLDHAWSAGKMIDSTGAGGTPTVPVNTPIIIGNSGTPPGPVSPPGGPSGPLPDSGGPISANLMGGFAGVGFDGTVYLHGLPRPTAKATSVSLSVWLDFNALLAPLSFTPDFNSGIIFNTKYDFAFTDGCAVEFTPTWQFLGGGGASSPYYPGQEFALAAEASPSYPAHWAHLMIAMRTNGYIDRGGGVNATPTQVVAVLNNSVVLNTIIYMADNGDGIPSYFDASGADSNTSTTYWDANEIGASRLLDPGFYTNSTKYYIDAGVTNYSSGLLKCGMAEFWLDWNRYVDWTQVGNQKLFHVTDGVVYQPCNLGKNGSKPFGARPLIYLSGDKTDFLYNRAQGNAAVTSIGSLLDVTDGFN